MLAVQLRLTEWVVAWTPVPESVIAAGEPVALLVTVTVPPSLPAPLGEKITPNVRVCEGASVTGVLAPLRENPDPLSVICEIMTLAFPVLVIVTFCVDEDPVLTLPKPRVVVLNERSSVAATPVPLRAITFGEFGALLRIVMLPLAAPAEAGANCALNVVD